MPRRAFSDEFDDSFPVDAELGNSAFFGRNVLRGLVDGIDDFIQLRQRRWSRYRALGPALLGSAMWIDDPELIHKIGELYAACIVVSKQRRKAPAQETGYAGQAQRAHAGHAHRSLLSPDRAGPQGGWPARGCRAVLAGLRRDGSHDPYPRLPQVARPSGEQPAPSCTPRWPYSVISGGTTRTEYPLSRMSSASGDPAVGVLRKLHELVAAQLEFGYWTEDPALVQGAERGSWSSSCGHPKRSIRTHVQERLPWHCSVVTQFVTLEACVVCDRRICGSCGSEARKTETDWAAYVNHAPLV